MGYLDITDFVSKFFSSVWRLFTNTHLPGFSHVSVASLTVGLFLATLGLRLLSYVLSFPGGSGGDSSRTISTKNPKISKERSKDEF